jgi:prophage tail gpP-like protein
MAINQIKVDIEGKSYTGWESVEVGDDLEQLGKDFTLTTNIPADKTYVIKKGQAVVIYLDNDKKLTGYVDKVRISEGATSSKMTVTGRDKSCDFVDSRLSNKTFTPPIDRDWETTTACPFFIT